MASKAAESRFMFPINSNSRGDLNAAGSNRHLRMTPRSVVREGGRMQSCYLHPIPIRPQCA